MAKKSNLNLYLIGLVLVVIGCFLPLTASKFFGGGSSAFKAITNGSGDLKIGSILALGGAIAGIVFCKIACQIDFAHRFNRRRCLCLVLLHERRRNPQRCRKTRPQSNRLQTRNRPYPDSCRLGNCFTRMVED